MHDTDMKMSDTSLRGELNIFTFRYWLKFLWMNNNKEENKKKHGIVIDWFIAGVIRRSDEEAGGRSINAD